MMHMHNSIERLNYKNSYDRLDLYLHKRRYQIAKKSIEGCLILDIGCGMGFGTKILASEMPGKKFVGIDIDEKSIEYAKRHNELPNIKFKLMDATKLGFPDCYFDSVVSIENIEHIEDYESYIKEVYRVLKANGRLFITTPNVNRVGNIIFKIIGHKLPLNPYHKHEFKVNEIKELLRRYNLKIFKIKGLYLHVLPTRCNIVLIVINIISVSQFLSNSSCNP